MNPERPEITCNVTLLLLLTVLARNKSTWYTKLTKQTSRNPKWCFENNTNCLLFFSQYKIKINDTNTGQFGHTDTDLYSSKLASESSCLFYLYSTGSKLDKTQSIGFMDTLQLIQGIRPNENENCWYVFRVRLFSRSNLAYLLFQWTVSFSKMNAS